MTRLLPRRPRLRLAPDSHRQLCHQVLERDGWRCQSCGRSTNLQIHHTGLSQHTIEAIRAGQPVRHTTLKRMQTAVE